MNVLHTFLHLDQFLNQGIEAFGPWIYLLLFVVVFCETGLVVMPFLPGDSLLFVLGTLSALGHLELPLLLFLLTVSAILGDSVNYAIGYRLGHKVFERDRPWLKKKYLLESQAFYERHGGKTILLARFIPMIRTFAPFVAGVGRMPYSRFAFFNILGGFLWVFSLVGAGYFFGNIPLIKENFEKVILAIIFISLLPFLLKLLRSRQG